LIEKGLYPVDAYLSYWAMHNETALEKISADALMVVRTDQISEKASAIAAFSGFPASAVRQDKSHAFANPDKSSLLHQFPVDFIEQRVERHCRSLMSRFFPEIKSLADAKL